MRISANLPTTENAIRGTRMLPYIPPPKPVSGWDYAALAAAVIASTGILAVAIWGFFALMPVGEHFAQFVVGRLH